MGTSLQDRTVVVIGRPSGIAREISEAAMAQGAQVVVGGRNVDSLVAAYEGRARAEQVDVTDDDSIAAFAERLGSIDHFVTTASARARGVLADLDRSAVLNSINTKVIGPLMLAKHLEPRIAEDGSFTLFSGVAAFKPVVGYLGVAITNGAADFLTRCLALELAPIRVNSISPGVIDTGAWDSMGEEGKQAYFEHFRTHNPARRIGTTQDIADAVLFAMTNPFLTGVTLRVDGGEPLT
jgi:NAD(P)-dependent dehydrogenase (short-subunit alcohol dehydrogenase family)